MALAGALALLTVGGAGSANRDVPTGPRGVAPGRVKSGTGFFVSSGGLVATSWHVVSGCTELVVWSGIGAERTGEVIARDQTSDIALLATNSPIPQYAVVSHQAPRVGEPVFTLAYGTSASEPRKAVATQGRFFGGSARPEGDPFLIIRARLHEGNSGAPVVDARGALIGMVTGRFTDQPDRAILASSPEIEALMSRLGLALDPSPPPAQPKMRPRDFLASVAVLVQCTPSDEHGADSHLHQNP